MKIKTVICAAVLTVAALPASAEGFYAGFGLGRVNGEQAAYSWTSTNAVGLGGYEFNEYISVEGEVSLVASDGSISGVDIGNQYMGAFVKFALPTSGSFTPHARIGYIKGKATASIGGVSISVDDTNISYGIGGEYDFGSSSLRVDYSVADFGAMETNSLSITNVWKF